MSAAVAHPQAPATAARGPLRSPRPSTYRLLGPGTTITPVATSRKTASVPADGMAAAYGHGSASLAAGCSDERRRSTHGNPDALLLRHGGVDAARPRARRLLAGGAGAAPGHPARGRRGGQRHRRRLPGRLGVRRLPVRIGGRPRRVRGAAADGGGALAG